MHRINPFGPPPFPLDPVPGSGPGRGASGMVNLRLIEPLEAEDGSGSLKDEDGALWCAVWEVAWVAPDLVSPGMGFEEARKRCAYVRQGVLGDHWTATFADASPRLIVSDYDTGRELFVVQGGGAP